VSGSSTLVVILIGGYAAGNEYTSTSCLCIFGPDREAALANASLSLDREQLMRSCNIPSATYIMRTASGSVPWLPALGLSA
jgi:hypothetical protein